MGKLLQLAGTEFAKQALVDFSTFFDRREKNRIREKYIRIKPPRKGEAGLFKSNRLLRGAQLEYRRALDINNFAKLAWLKFINGATPQEVRQILHSGAIAWLPVITEFDFSPRWQEGHSLTFKQANEFVRLFNGTTLNRSGAAYHVRWQSRPEPDHHQFQTALFCAAISGDQSLAKELARGYQMLELGQYTAQFEIRAALFQLLLAERDEDAEKISKLLTTSYPADFPHERIELPLAIMRHDETLFANGMTAINTRFQTRWTETAYRRKYEERRAKRPASITSSIDDWFDRVREDLIAHHWQWSTWAIAHVNVARWRGMNAIFDQPKLFSQWIPLELCETDRSTAH